MNLAACRTAWSAALFLSLMPAANAEPPLTDRLGDPLPPGASARLGTLRFRHGVSVDALVIGPDGKTIASGGSDGSVCLWDAGTGKLVRKLTKHQRAVKHLAIAPDGSVLATSDETVVFLWETATGQLRNQLAYEGRATPVFSADGKFLAVGDGDKVHIRELSTGKERHVIVANTTRSVRTLGLSPDGKLLAIARDGSGIVHLHDVATGKKLRTYDGNEGTVSAIAFTSEGKGLATGDGYGKVLVWETGSEDECGSFSLDEREVAALAFADGGRTLNVLDQYGVVSRREVATGRELETIGKKDEESSAQFALSADGKRLARGEDGNIRVRDLATGKDVPDLGQQPRFYRAAWSPGSNTVTLEASDQSLLFWEPGSERQPRRLVAPDGGAFSASYSSDGKLVASTGEKDSIRLWDAATGKEVRQVRLEAKNVRPLAFAPYGQSLALWCDGDELVVVDALTGQERLRIKNTGAPALEAVFTPDGRSLIVAGRDKSLWLWEVATGKERKRIALVEAPSSLAVAPDGVLAVVGDYSGSLRFYHLGRGKILRTLTGHEGHVVSLAYSPDGKLLASGGADGTVRLWDPASGRELRRLAGHEGIVYGLAFSADGKVLVSTSDDATALAWDVTAALEVRAGQVPPAEKIRSLEELWADLGEQDAAQAYAAIQGLAERPQEALPILKEHLKAAAPVAADDVARLLRDLDSDRFETRNRAAKELEALDPVPVPSLRKVLADNPSPEVRRVLEEILARVGGPVTHPDRLRALRAVEVLETIATPEARRLLEALASGTPEAQLTADARAAAERLKRRLAAPR